MRTTILVAITAALVAAWASVAAAARQTFDAVSFEAPSGFAVARAATGVTMQESDAKAGTFALVVVAPSAASAGSLDQDFQAAWASAVVPTFAVTDAPAMTPGAPIDGWALTSGAAKGTVQGVATSVMLVVLTGNGRTETIIIAMNAGTYLPAVEQFLHSLRMTAPAAGAPQPPAGPAGPAGSTKFDDGWTSSAEGDWVRVARPGATVLLHYAVALDDTTRRDVTGSFWGSLVAPRYAIKKQNRFDFSQTSFPYYFATADATERATGRAVFVALRVVTANGIAFPIEVVTDSQAAFQRVFPDQDKLAAIAGANRFAVGDDVVGTWSGSTGSSVNMYYTGTGGYAGTNATAMSDVFTFGPKGVYASKHQGATGMVGSMKTYSEKRAGTYSVAPWEITVKLNGGKTTVYSAYYERVRGGRILHLQDKQYAGMNYALRLDK